MTTPPPGQWPPPQPSGFPPGPPQWGPPPQWGQQPPPQNGGNRAKWILGALVLLVVVVVTVVTTLLFTRDGSDSNPPNATLPPSTSLDTSDIASADDLGPITVITDDPTCHSWTAIGAAFAHASTNGWDTRDPKIPASEWTKEQRNQYEAVATSMRQLADRTVSVATRTPHRVMRVLYEQFIAYSRAYINQIDEYTAQDDHFVRAAIGISTALNAVCDSIEFGAAAARSPLVPSAAAPRGLPQDPNPSESKPFLVSANPICNEWLAAAKRFTEATVAWRTVDPNTPAAALSPEQRVINDAVMPVMENFATESQLLGRESDNAAWADIATLSAQYRRAYVSALPTYAPADNDLQVVAGSAAGAISEACRVVET